MSYFLDTNICIALMNGTNPKVRRRMKSALDAHNAISLSSIVSFELWFGAANSQRVNANELALKEFLSKGFKILDFNANDALVAGRIRAELKKAGTPIGAYDLLIAGQALARNLVLVTANTREFGRIHGLKFEDWTL